MDALTRWTPDLWVIAPAALAALLYARGAAKGWPRRWCFWLGGAVALAAVLSGLDTRAHWSLAWHMTQHVLLVFVAAPLLVLGSPGMAFFRGLPAGVRREWVGPILRLRGVRAALRFLVHPVTCWIAFLVSTWGWHWPPAYELATARDAWHRVEHLSFLAGGILFWWHVFPPRPWRSPWHPMARAVYVLAGDAQNTVFCAILAFAGKPLYGEYAARATGAGLDALADQTRAAAIMWVAGQVTLLPAAAWIVRSMFVGRERRTVASPTIVRRDRRPFDLLRVPVLGALLASSRARGALRWIMLGAALLIVLDGFRGPEVAPENLAGTLPWTHWRGLAVVALVVGGNLACMACPFVAPGRLLRRWVRPRWEWPAALSGKWIAAGLLVAWLVLYESLDLWDSPWATGVVILLYFALAMLVDLLFRGTAFCRHVCPLGQYHMALSLASPLSIAPRETKACAACTSHACLHACGMGLFVASKAGNHDCTMCMDCVAACPVDNVGLLALPRRESLVELRVRPGPGRLSRRWDVALLLALVTVGGFVNAAGMTGPWQDAVERIGGSMAVGEGASVLLAMLVCMGVLVLAPALGRGVEGGTCEAAVRGSLVLLPLGAGMWLAHLGYHLVTAWGTAMPAITRFLLDHGAPESIMGEPQWAASCCGPVPGWLVPAEIIALDVAFACAVFLSGRHFARGGRWWWVASAAALWAAGVWIVLQPMQMRGMIMP